MVGPLVAAASLSRRLRRNPGRSDWGPSYAVAANVGGMRRCEEMLCSGDGPALSCGLSRISPTKAIFSIFFLTRVVFLQANKVVVVLNGRYAGRKAVIVKNFDEGTTSRPYGHALVVGINIYPRKIVKAQNAKTKDKKSRVKAFVKTVNYNHLMPTRYTLDLDLKARPGPPHAIFRLILNLII